MKVFTCFYWVYADYMRIILANSMGILMGIMWICDIITYIIQPSTMMISGYTRETNRAFLEIPELNGGLSADRMCHLGIIPLTNYNTIYG